MRLSVIIPGYNTPNICWRRCLKSVLAALPQESEVICVDDGSVEKPQVAINDGRVRWIFLEKKAGQAAARNRALEDALGEYVTFVDSDDEVVPGVYVDALKKIEEAGSDVCFFGVRVVWEKEGLQRTDIPGDRYYGVLTADDVHHILQHWLLLYPVNKIFAKRSIGRFDPEGMPCEDAMFNLELIIRKTTWCSIPKIGYIYYRTDGTSLSRYKACDSVGRQHMAEMWHRYCMTDARARTLFESKCELTPKQRAQCEWDNIWKQGSPYSLIGRWHWLRAHPDLGGPSCFIRTFARYLVRRYFYIKPIRRANIRRLCKGKVEEYHG